MNPGRIYKGQYKKNKRNAQLDIIKGLCIIGIIFSHAGHELVWFSYFYLYGFYFVSGVTYRDTTFIRVLFSKIKRIYVPFVIANLFAKIVCSFLQRIGIYSGESYRWNVYITSVLKFNLKEPLMAPSWFLFSLFVISILFYFLKRIFKNDVVLFLSTCLLFMTTVHYRNIIPHIVWNNCVIIINVAIGLFLYTCGYLYSRNDSIKDYIETGKNTFDIFIVSVVLLCEAKYYGNYYLDLRAGIISNGKWMLVTCVAGIYFLIYFSNAILRCSPPLKNMLSYIGKRSMSLMFFHVLSFSVFTLIGVYILHKPYSVSWANALYEKQWYRYINAFVGLIIPLAFDNLIERVWSARSNVSDDKNE